VGYFVVVLVMDVVLGKVVVMVDELGLWGSIVIVFCSDNGFNVGYYGIWGKGNVIWLLNMYDLFVKVLVIIS